MGKYSVLTGEKKLQTNTSVLIVSVSVLLLWGLVLTNPTDSRIYFWLAVVFTTSFLIILFITIFQEYKYYQTVTGKLIKKYPRLEDKFGKQYLWELINDPNTDPLDMKDLKALYEIRAYFDSKDLTVNGKSQEIPFNNDSL